MASNVTPSLPEPHRYSSAISYAVAQRFDLADMDVQTPETPVRFSLRLGVYSPSQVLQIHGRLYHLALASLLPENHSQQGPFAPRALPRFIATADPSDTLSPSVDFPVSRLYGLPCSADFSPGRGGFLQLLSTSLSPCRRLPPRRGQSAASVRFAAFHVAFALTFAGSASRGSIVSRPLLRSLSLRPGDS